MITTFIFYILSFLIAVTGYVFVFFLTQPGDILGKWHEFVVKHFPEYLQKPLATCEYCVTGQLALWIYPFYFINYFILDHIFFICLSILLVHTLKTTLKKWN